MSAKLSYPDLPDPTAANAVTACDLSSRAAFLGEPDIPESPQISPPDPLRTIPWLERMPGESAACYRHSLSLAWDAFHYPSWPEGFRLVASRSGQRWPDASPINLPEEVTMYARLTTFRVKPDKIGDMLRWRQERAIQHLYLEL